METLDQVVNRMKNKKTNISAIHPSFITKMLLSIILVFLFMIYFKLDNKNMDNIKENLFTNSMEFTKVNKWYKKTFGSIAPTIDNDEMVFENKPLIVSSEVTKNYEKLTLSDSLIKCFSGGIVVFIGEKENLGNTIIIQGNDGYDIWYSNIENISLSVYDYVSEGTILGEAKDKILYLNIKNDKETLSYEKYKN